MKINNAVAKNLMIFLQRCIYLNITPESFLLKKPIKSIKAFNIMNKYQKKLILISKNNTKERMYSAAPTANELCQNLKAKVLEEHFLLFSLFSLLRVAYLRSIHYEYRKIRTRKNSVFGHFSRSDKKIKRK